MKKILAMLCAISLTGVTASSVVACGPTSDITSIISAKIDGDGLTIHLHFAPGVSATKNDVVIEGNKTDVGKTAIFNDDATVIVLAKAIDCNAKLSVTFTKEKPIMIDTSKIQHDNAKLNLATVLQSDLSKPYIEYQDHAKTLQDYDLTVIYMFKNNILQLSNLKKEDVDISFYNADSNIALSDLNDIVLYGVLKIKMVAHRDVSYLADKSATRLLSVFINH